MLAVTLAYESARSCSPNDTGRNIPRTPAPVFTHNRLAIDHELQPVRLVEVPTGLVVDHRIQIIAAQTTSDVARTEQVRALQWGRGLATAEIDSKTCRSASIFKLQWGRGLVTAGIDSKTCRSASIFELQWGRGLVTAERSRPSPTSNSTHELQWGRGLVTAEGPLAPGICLSAPHGRQNERLVAVALQRLTGRH